MSELAFAHLWGDAERRRVVRLCAAITRDRDAAEDLAQETLLEAWRHRHRLHDASGAERWLAAIARNVCLRWARSRGADVPAAELPEVAEVELERSELEELLERALSLLPPETRDVLVHHYVHESPHAEIAARLGVSEAAVSMRVSRGRVELRRLLAHEQGRPDAGWTQTRVWCTKCGERRLEMRRDDDAVRFRCTTCSPGPASVYDFANPLFRRLLADVVRPTAILSRTSAWASEYFASGAGAAGCTRCGGAILLRHHDDERRGLTGRCSACALEMWMSLDGLAQSAPASRAFAKDHGRVRTLAAREARYDGTEASVVRLEAVGARAGLDVVFERHTLRHLATV